MKYFLHPFSFLPLIQEGLSVTSQSTFMCIKYCLTAQSSLPRKKVVRLTDHPDMIIAVDWDVKNSTNQQFFKKIVRLLLNYTCNSISDI